MSRFYDARQQVIAAYPTKCDAGIDLCLDFMDMSRSDFEYECNETVEGYLWPEVNQPKDSEANSNTESNNNLKNKE